MEIEYYAKSEPKETIKEHTHKLLENLEILRKTYGKQIAKISNREENRFWQLMEIICLYHDIGKVFSGFQNEIRSRLLLELIDTKYDNNTVRHEQISPIFVPHKKYNMTMDERKLVYQAIYYHHERNNIKNVDSRLLQEIIEKELEPNLEEISEQLGLKVEIEDKNKFYLGLTEGQSRIKEGNPLYKDYCLMKGLLHRLDHSSSAGEKVEDETNEAISELVEEFIHQKGFKLNDLQIYTKENEKKNLIVVGSTGIGKTEGALLWSKNSKTFFTLPLRISINAIYDRMKENIGYQHVGLLHSTALDYLEEKSEEEQEGKKIEYARNLYEKLTTCTIDQIFPFVFKYKGYEKIYATLSYSKVIIDEIQAYSPEIVAVILKGLQMINDLGGRFMIMTATLPRIYKDKMEEMGIKFEYKEWIKDTKRHRIELLDKTINEDRQEINEKAKNKKVLIIVNTINKAIELYNELKNNGTDNVNLLHSRFIPEDRNAKERAIKEFSNQKAKVGIWITTQIVEASIDIDFDLLYTEMSTLDSLFQRLGRCYRSREYEGKEPNVKIYTKNVSGIKYVYDEEIYKKSIELLATYTGTILKEKEKIELVDRLYSKELLEDTEFYKTFRKSFSILNNIVDYDTSKKEAQKILRNIEHIDVIPKNIYDKNLAIFKQYEEEKDYQQKTKIRRDLNKLFVSINKSNRWKLGNYITECPYWKEKYIIDTKYSEEEGLYLKIDEEYELETREF